MDDDEEDDDEYDDSEVLEIPLMEGDEPEEEEEQFDERGRKIRVAVPTWQDALEDIISGNMEARQKSPRRGGGGGGGSRGSRGGRGGRGGRPQGDRDRDRNRS